MSVGRLDLILPKISQLRASVVETRILGGAGHGLRLSIMIILFYSQSKPQDWVQDAAKGKTTGARDTPPLSQLKAPAVRSCRLPPPFNMEDAFQAPFLPPSATHAARIRQEPATRFVFWSIILGEELGVVLRTARNLFLGHGMKTFFGFPMGCGFCGA